MREIKIGLKILDDENNIMELKNIYDNVLKFITVKKNTSTIERTMHKNSFIEFIKNKKYKIIENA